MIMEVSHKKWIFFFKIFIWHLVIRFHRLIRSSFENKN